MQLTLHHQSGLARKLGPDFFITKGLTPTRWESLFFGSEDWTRPWIVVASSDLGWLREKCETVLAAGGVVDWSTFHRGSFSASMENCNVSLEECAK